VSSSKRDLGRDLKVIVDTNVIFSAILTLGGNEYRLFLLADIGELEIIIFDYILDEIKTILEKKRISLTLLPDFLDTFNNIRIETIENVTEEEIQRSINSVRHEKDRPIFIFAYRSIDEDADTFLITGDKDLRTELVKKALKGHSMSAREFLELYIERGS
jgi:putative PIN family toxin of toxin-antitoxin system